MKITVKSSKQVEIATLAVSAGVRYWEDATVNGVEDSEGTLIPFRDGEYWVPVIDLETGIIKDWPQGTVADIHYKVCDDGDYTLLDADGNIVKKIEGYVPKLMSPAENGFGDYIIMKVDENGKIANWKPTFEEFEHGSDEDDE